MPTAFSSPDQIVIPEAISSSSPPPCLDQEQLEEVFELKRCEDWLREHKYSRVCLQFPDHLLQEAPPVARLLQERLQQEVYILGDTTYGACCVDEVAAAHTNADCVIHFGHTCLTPARSLPVLYIFTRVPLCLSSLATSLASLPGQEKILLLWDVEYEHCLADWRAGGDRIVKGCCDHEAEGILRMGRKIGVGDMKELEGATVVYVGRGEETLLNFVHNMPQHNFLQWEAGSLIPAGLAVGKLLMRRYYLVEKTKDASRIGLLVGTLGTKDFTQMLDKLRQVIRAAGKRPYTFLVGKPNVAKLANFPEIDVFVLVACPEMSFIDSRDFLQPVVTPWELEMACNRDLTWTGEYVTDFRSLLPGGEHYTPVQEERQEQEEQEGDMSLVTGRVRSRGLGQGEAGGELTVVNSKTVAVLHEGGGGEFLAAKSWSGLEQELGRTEVVEVVQGGRGLAMGYSQEPQL